MTKSDTSPQLISNNKRRFFGILLAVGFILTAVTTTSAEDDDFPFPVGETLYYKIHWKNIAGGHAKISIEKRFDWKGKDVLLLRTTAKSVPFVDAFMKVRDEIKTYYDIKARRPLLTVKNLNEGFYLRRYTAVFNPGARSVSFKQKELKGNTADGKQIEDAEWKESSGTVKNLPIDTQDVLSLLMYMRTDKRQGKAGQTIEIPFFDDGKLTTLRMKVIKKTTFSNSAGTFPALVTEPAFKTTGFFKSKGKIRVYVSDDKNRYPLKIEAAIPIIGNLNIELVRIVN